MFATQQENTGSGLIRVDNIAPKARKVRGVVYQPQESNTYNAEIKKNESIRLFGVYRNRASGPKAFDVTFKMGDMAEYDSYNLKYMGRITTITEKTITIEAYPGTSNAERHRLDLHEFCWRNWDFKLELVQKYNQEESYCI